MNVTFDYYRIFYYVAKCGSFTKAAEMLGNSQPNVTRAMNNLESQTGLKLMIRSKHGVKLTPEGQQLYDHVKVAFHHISLAEEEMERQSSLISGIIVIGVSEIALHEVLLPVLSNFYKKYPNVKVQITNQSTPATIEALKASQVQFALVTSPFEIGKSQNAIKIKSFHEYLMASNSFEQLKDKVHKVSELTKYPWVSLLQKTATRKYHETFFANNGFIFEPQMSVATTDQVLPMIKAGLGIGFVPEHMMNPEEEGIFQIQMKPYPKQRSVYLITDEEHPLSIASSILIEEIKKSAEIE